MPKKSPILVFWPVHTFDKSREHPLNTNTLIHHLAHMDAPAVVPAFTFIPDTGDQSRIEIYPV
jgi:hypothetical protein